MNSMDFENFRLFNVKGNTHTPRSNTFMQNLIGGTQQNFNSQYPKTMNMPPHVRSE